jgi:hypothetical protein
LIAGSIVAPLLLGASEPLRLQPSSPWVVDYADQSCRLIRTFGEGKQLTKLLFQSEGPGSIEMIVIGEPMRSSGPVMRAKLMPVDNKLKPGATAMTADRRQTAALWSDVDFLPSEAMERDEQAARYYAATGIRPPAEPLPMQAAKKAERQRFAN